jgi:arginyl-tRNA--protein-N-Asp/Glu arginylyltransferase
MTPVLDDAFICDSVPAEAMDGLWAAGWRHFGRYFFRYSTQPGEHGDAQTITPLRIDLVRFTPSKSQRRVLRKNADLKWEITPVRLDNELRAMFQRHKERFSYNVPDTLETFLGHDPVSGPCECHMLRVFEKDRLIAASFFDVGKTAASSVYGIFEPEQSKRSLGIFTMLLEVQHCREAGLKWLYPGYATHESSAYDYKKQFHGTEMLDWSTGEWRALGSR